MTDCTELQLAAPRRDLAGEGQKGMAKAALRRAIFFLLASIGLRIYLIAIGRTGYTYGALAAPIAFLLFTFFIGLAIVIGAHFNSAIQEMWPARMTSRQRRSWRKLEMVRAAGRLREQNDGDEPPEQPNERPTAQSDQPSESADRQ